MRRNELQPVVGALLLRMLCALPAMASTDVDVLEQPVAELTRQLEETRRELAAAKGEPTVTGALDAGADDVAIVSRKMIARASSPKPMRHWTNPPRKARCSRSDPSPSAAPCGSTMSWAGTTFKPRAVRRLGLGPMSKTSVHQVVPVTHSLVYRPTRAAPLM